MKRTSLVTASILLAFTGCTCGQSWRPHIFSRLHDRIHGTNVGAPCASGACASAPLMAAPAMADAGCETCGSGVQTLSYEGYEGRPTPSYSGEMVGGTYGGVIQGQQVYGGGEVVSPIRAQ